MTAARKAIVHVGTHKTGTKSIQLYMTRNLATLDAAGFYYPNTGRRFFNEELATPGHHDLAVELAQGRTDLVHRLLSEIAENGSQTVFISSEELHPLAFHDGALAVLRAALRDSGYEPTVVVYLRAQADYAQSIYAELSKTHEVNSFGEYVQSILRDGHFGAYQSYAIEFQYSRLVLALADIFGGANVVVRPYVPGRDPAALVLDMMRVIAAIRGPLPQAALTDPNLAVNTRSTFRALLGDIEDTAKRRTPDALGVSELAKRLHVDLTDPIFETPFSAMTRDERLAFIQRFRDDNADVEAMASIVLPGTRESDVTPANDPLWDRAQRQRAVLDLMMDAWFR